MVVCYVFFTSEAATLFDILLCTGIQYPHLNFEERSDFVDLWGPFVSFEICLPVKIGMQPDVLFEDVKTDR